MVVCSYYASGNCRFGDSCRFEHVRPAEVNRYRWSGGSQQQPDLRQSVLTRAAPMARPPQSGTFVSPLHQRTVTFSQTPVVQTPNFQLAQTSTPRQSILKSSTLQTDHISPPSLPINQAIEQSQTQQQFSIKIPDYSERQELSSEDLQEFLRSHFTRVPIDPPPMEYC